MDQFTCTVNIMAKSGHNLQVSEDRQTDIHITVLCTPTGERCLSNTLCLKNSTPKAGRHKFYYFPNTKKNPKYVLYGFSF